jgi:hypothetical protein
MTGLDETKGQGGDGDETGGGKSVFHDVTPV